jgi:cytochrome b involved in lipid metabolism
MLDVGGQDSTEAFEDVGHSDEAREILEGLLVGKLKRQVRFCLLAYFALPFTLPLLSPPDLPWHPTLVPPKNPIRRPEFLFFFSPYRLEY